MVRKTFGPDDDGMGSRSDAAVGGDLDEESTLLLLALLEQVEVDRARGAIHDLSDYCADYPELADIFLDMVQATDSDTGALHLAVTDAPARKPLSAGVIRALSQLSDLAPVPRSSGRLPERKIAESGVPYRPDEDDVSGRDE